MKNAMTTMKRRAAANRRAAIRSYRESNRELFEDAPIQDVSGDCVSNLDAMVSGFGTMTSAFGKNKVAVAVLDEEILALAAQALVLPTWLTYDDYHLVKENGQDVWKPHREAFEPEEGRRVGALQRAIYDYCKAAAGVARRVASSTAPEWNFAYKTIERHCLEGCVTFPACPPDEARRIFGILRDQPMILQADVELCRSERAQDSRATEGARPLVPSRYRGRTLSQSAGVWIGVEKDGATYVCLTRVGNAIRTKRYTMTRQEQISFLDDLMDCFEANAWYKPVVNKAKWQPLYFNRGDAKRFLDDGHIGCWQGEPDGFKGGIRLIVP